MNLRDQWMLIDKLISQDPLDQQLTRLIEDGCEVLEFIQDVYNVVVNYEPYHRMMTDCLLKILYVPVVLQSLCDFTVKPKLQIQTALFLLTQSIMNIKDEVMSKHLIELSMGNQISSEFKTLLTKKDLYSSPLYSSQFKHTHSHEFTNLRIGCAFGYQSREMFDTYLHSQWIKRQKANELVKQG